MRNRPETAPPRNGFAIIRWDVLTTFWSSGFMGRWDAPPSILRSAEASARGSPVSLAPSSSASYSRVREMASWITVAATGARNAMSNPTSMLPPRLSSPRPPPKMAANCSTCAAEVMSPATAAATDEVRMSLLYTCMSSWPSTARSSRSSSICRIPSVQHTAALSGLRPVANALGLMVGAMYSRGMGCSARRESSSTIRYMAGACCGLTGTARMDRMASLSEFQ